MEPGGGEGGAFQISLGTDDLGMTAGIKIIGDRAPSEDNGYGGGRGALRGGRWGGCGKDKGVSHIIGSLPMYVTTEVDHCMDGVYGYHTHKNNRTHLGGGVLDNAICECQWRCLLVYPECHYNVPREPSANSSSMA